MAVPPAAPDRELIKVGGTLGTLRVPCAVKTAAYGVCRVCLFDQMRTESCRFSLAEQLRLRVGEKEVRKSAVSARSAAFLNQ